MNHLRLEMRLTFKTPFHTTGNRWRWGADKSLAVSADGSYVIPATTLKGRLRAHAETLLRSWGVHTCLGPEPGTMCSDLQNLCLVCRVFGNPRQPAPLKFTDAQPLAPRDRVGSQIRSGVSISRQRRTAFHQRLFFIETANAASAEWGAIGEGYFGEEELARQAAALITLTARFILTLGGGRSRGLGWIDQWKVQATLNQQPLSEDALQKYWQSWARGGQT